jgi:hypothetical protein
MTQDTAAAEKDAPIAIGGRLEEKVQCANCKKEGVLSEFFTYQSKGGEETYLCGACRDAVNAELEEETKNVRTWGAIGLGTVAAVVSSVVWFYITKFTDMEFGYLAIGVGYFVGFSIFYGAGKRRAKNLQTWSVVLTFLSILVAKYFLMAHFLFQYMLANPAEFEGWDGQKVWFDPWNGFFLESLISPIGLLIYAIGLYVAWNVCKPRKI